MYARQRLHKDKLVAPVQVLAFLACSVVAALMQATAAAQDCGVCEAAVSRSLEQRFSLQSSEDLSTRVAELMCRRSEESRAWRVTQSGSALLPEGLFSADGSFNTSSSSAEADCRAHVASLHRSSHLNLVRTVIDPRPGLTAFVQCAEICLRPQAISHRLTQGSRTVSGASIAVGQSFSWEITYRQLEPGARPPRVLERMLLTSRGVLRCTGFHRRVLRNGLSNLAPATSSCVRLSPDGAVLTLHTDQGSITEYIPPLNPVPPSPDPNEYREAVTSDQGAQYRWPPTPHGEGRSWQPYRVLTARPGARVAVRVSTVRFGADFFPPNPGDPPPRNILTALLRVRIAGADVPLFLCDEAEGGHCGERDARVIVNVGEDGRLPVEIMGSTCVCGACANSRPRGCLVELRFAVEEISDSRGPTRAAPQPAQP
jgi:hypothetical protein